MPCRMEYTGFEPVASTMRMLRAPNCANTPRLNYYITKNIKMEEFFDLYLQEKMWMVELSRVRSFLYAMKATYLLNQNYAFVIGRCR